MCVPPAIPQWPTLLVLSIVVIFGSLFVVLVLLFTLCLLLLNCFFRSLEVSGNDLQDAEDALGCVLISAVFSRNVGRIGCKVAHSLSRAISLWGCVGLLLDKLGLGVKLLEDSQSKINRLLARIC